VTDADDQRLLRDVRAGRRDACAELVRGHYPAVYRFLLHLTRDVPLAEDLTQETFAAAWKRVGDFEGRSALATWFHRIAYGKFVDARRAGRRRGDLVERLKNRAGGAPDDPFDCAVAGEEARNLHAALARLEPEERAALVLHYLQGLSYREAAEVLGEPAGTVKWRTSAALTKLRGLLAAEVERHEP
jgi:RNA polymerase sigma-70 factor (ECF subfamily)